MRLYPDALRDASWTLLSDNVVYRRRFLCSGISGGCDVCWGDMHDYGVSHGVTT